MPRVICDACHDLPAALPALVCRSCSAQAGRDLAALPEWHEALLVPPTGQRGPRGKGSSAPLPMSDRAGDVRARIHNDLAGWVRTVHEAHEDAEPDAELDWPANTVTAMAEWLDAYRLGLLEGDEAAEFVNALRALVTSAEKTAAPGRSDLVYIGEHRCQADGTKGRVLVDPRTQDGRCTACGEKAHVQWWRQHIAPEHGAPMRLAELPIWLAVHRELVVTLEQLRKWSRPQVSRSHVEGCEDATCTGCLRLPALLSPVGEDGKHVPEDQRKGRTLRYDPEAVVTIIKARLEARGKVSA